VLLASLAVFAMCAAIVADGRVGPAERAVFHAVNGLPDWLYGPMLLFQYLGVLAMPLVVAVGALALRRWRLAAALALVVPLKLATERVAKLLVERERPGTTVADATLRGVHPAGLSFVSGHAIITFAIAGLLVLVLPRRWGSWRSCWRASTRSPGCTWARTTRWMWSAGPRSAWRSPPRSTWRWTSPVTAVAAGAGAPPRQERIAPPETGPQRAVVRLRSPCGAAVGSAAPGSVGGASHCRGLRQVL
jgi:membrane-associated phospholipid phosphatase